MNPMTPPLHQSQLPEDLDAYTQPRRIKVGCLHQFACGCDTPYWLRHPTTSELSRWYKVMLEVSK